MRKKKIAILGASYLQAPIVQKSREMHLESHCFAWDNEEAVCKGLADYFYPISVLEKEAILDKCIEIGIDGILTIATDICVPTISYIAQEMNLKSNSVQSSILSTNKGKMRETFLHNNIKSPNFYKVTAKSNVLNSINLRYPVIVKPSDRSGSRGVSKIDYKKELFPAIETALGESIIEEAVVEEYFEGNEVSVESISWNGEHKVITVTDKITTGSPYFVEIEHHQPSMLSNKLIKKIKNETVRALDALEITDGASHAEFKVNDLGEIMIIEVGARMGGDFIGSHLVELSTGYDYLKGVLDVALNDFTFPNEFDNKQCSGVYFLSKETEYLMPYFQAKNNFDVDKKITNKELSYINNSNKRSGYLIYQNESKVTLV